MMLYIFTDVELNDCKGCKLAWMNHFYLDLYAPNGDLDHQYKVDDILGIDLRKKNNHQITFGLKPAAKTVAVIPRPKPRSNNPFEDSLEEDDSVETQRPMQSPIPKLNQLSTGLVILKIRFKNEAHYDKMIAFLLGAKLFTVETYLVRDPWRLCRMVKKAKLVLPKWRRYALKEQLKSGILDGWKNVKLVDIGRVPDS